MKSRLIHAALAVVLLACGAGAAFAQTPQSQAAVDQAIEQFRKDARTDINTLIQASMQFTADDAAKFWPLYKTYEQTRKGLVDERLAVVKEYAKNYPAMSDAKATELLQRALDLEAKNSAAKKSFLAELQKVLPGRLVARFYQVHTRIDMMVDALFAAEVPLVK